MVFIHNLLLILGRGIGQVMFQNNALSGLFMLIGIFLNSWQMGILAVCGNIISTLTAHFSGYKYDDIKVWGMLGVCSWLIPDLLSVSYTVIDTTQNINYFQAFCLGIRSEEHTSELQSHRFISYAVFCLKKNITNFYLKTNLVILRSYYFLYH